jgi:uncharacterized RDD family membrane protein YckC
MESAASVEAMQRHPLRRLIAWLIDCLWVLGWAGLVAAIGVPLYLAGVTRGLDELALNIVAALTIVIPVTIALAAFESSRSRATPGKRALRLAVASRRSDPTAFSRALARNATKVALPWLIGHAAVIALVQSSDTSAAPSPWVWALLAAAYVLPVLYVVALFVGSGRTPYDRMSGTTVFRQDGTRKAGSR